MDNSRYRTPGATLTPGLLGLAGPDPGSQKGLLAALLADILPDRVAGAKSAPSRYFLLR